MSKKNVAVLQFEIDRERWLGVNPADFVRNGTLNDETAIIRLRMIARTAINDTIRNGGTFVLIAGKRKITMVQRADAEEIEDETMTAPTPAQSGGLS